MALVVARRRIREHGLGSVLQVESAGTHAPSPPQAVDPRTIAALERRHYHPEPTLSTCITPGHFKHFDLLLAVDRPNLTELQKRCPAEHAAKLRLLLSYAPQTGRVDVPDPYFGNAQAFELVLDLCEAAIDGLLRSYTAK